MLELIIKRGEGVVAFGHHSDNVHVKCEMNVWSGVTGEAVWSSFRHLFSNFPARAPLRANVLRRLHSNK